MIKTLTQRRLEFLEEGVNYYAADTTRRATTPQGGCSYLNEEGKKCFIGRHVTDCEELVRMGLKNSFFDKSFAPIMPAEVMGLGVTFLQSCQDLHDNATCWDKNGLTIFGKIKMDRIKNTYIAEAVDSPII